MTNKRKRQPSRRYRQPEGSSDDPANNNLPLTSIQVDGSVGEGGGQIVRTSLALSSVLHRSVTISKIRYGRARPGLQAQHVTGAQLVAAICNATLRGARRDSQTLSLHPDIAVTTHDHPTSVRDPNNPFLASVGTAGATSLVLQAALPAALHVLPSSTNPVLRLDGGTTALFAPTSAYVAHVLTPNLRRFGFDLHIQLVKHGFFPEGGGQCDIAIDKTNCVAHMDDTTSRVLRPIMLLTRPTIIAFHGIVLECGAAYSQIGLGAAMQDGATRTLRRLLVDVADVPAMCRDADQLSDAIALHCIPSNEARGKCIAVTLWADTADGGALGASAIWSERDITRLAEHTNLSRGGNFDRGELWKKTAAEAGETAARELVDSIVGGAAVDSHMADQICTYMAMADGTSRVVVPPPSQHVRTVVDVIRGFGVDIQMEDVVGSNNKLIVCTGQGVTLAP